mmetsp:Transcript_50509/g.163496  ORF Transcript_50509/g.163496 Transcript_50509/m.163496 type:complete len:249 (+) Transcript_50509:427-1173(+)
MRCLVWTKPRSAARHHEEKGALHEEANDEAASPADPVGQHDRQYDAEQVSDVEQHQNTVWQADLARRHELLKDAWAPIVDEHRGDCERPVDHDAKDEQCAVGSQEQCQARATVQWACLVDCNVAQTEPFGRAIFATATARMHLPQDSSRHRLAALRQQESRRLVCLIHGDRQQSKPSATDKQQWPPSVTGGPGDEDDNASADGPPQRDGCHQGPPAPRRQKLHVPNRESIHCDCPSRPLNDPEQQEKG